MDDIAAKLAALFTPQPMTPEKKAARAAQDQKWAEMLPGWPADALGGYPSISPNDAMAVMGSTRSVGNISDLLRNAFSTKPNVTSIPKSGPQIAEGSAFPDVDTFRGRMEIQGGALAAKPGVDRIIKTLESHGMKWEYAPNGGITAYSEVVGPGGKVFLEGKHFADNSSLKTLRDWLGY